MITSGQKETPGRSLLPLSTDVSRCFRAAKELGVSKLGFEEGAFRSRKSCDGLPAMLLGSKSRATESRATTGS